MVSPCGNATSGTASAGGDSDVRAVTVSGNDAASAAGSRTGDVVACSDATSAFAGSCCKSFLQPVKTGWRGDSSRVDAPFVTSGACLKTMPSGVLAGREEGGAIK